MSVGHGHPKAYELAIEFASRYGLAPETIREMAAAMSAAFAHAPADPHVTVEQFAAELNTHPETVKRMIRSRTLPESAIVPVGQKGKRRTYRINSSAAMEALRNVPIVPLPPALPRRRPRSAPGNLPVLRVQ